MKGRNMDTFVYKDHKKLRCGYTTGTCAALAAQGAVRFLLTGSWKETEEIMSPEGDPGRRLSGGEVFWGRLGRVRGPEGCRG